VTAVTLLLPLPPRALSPNARPHWAQRAHAAREYAHTVNFETWDQLSLERPRFKRASLVVFFIVGNRGHLYRDEYRPADADNALASFKAGIDGLVRSDVLLADDAEHLAVRCCVVRAQMRGGLVAVCIEGET